MRTPGATSAKSTGRAGGRTRFERRTARRRKSLLRSVARASARSTQSQDLPNRRILGTAPSAFPFIRREDVTRADGANRRRERETYGRVSSSSRLLFTPTGATQSSFYAAASTRNLLSLSYRERCHQPRPPRGHMKRAGSRRLRTAFEPMAIVAPTLCALTVFACQRCSRRRRLPRSVWVPVERSTRSISLSGYLYVKDLSDIVVC